MVPQISVILPVYNGMDHLIQSVTSVLNQTCRHFEFLIVDDCSEDGSWAYLQSQNDHRIRLYRNERNQGLFFNLNFLIKNSNTPLIKLWAQDDVMYPRCLEKFMAFHQKHPAIGFSYSSRDIIDENGRVKELNFSDNTPDIVSPDQHAWIAFFTGSIAGNISNVCISKKALDEVGLFDEKMKISADFDMWVRLARNHTTGFIADKLIQLRDHARQLSRKENFYINHVKEDLIVYRNLLSYVSPGMKKEGEMILRHYKFVFYYTLMLKALIKGKLKTAYSFYRELRSMDNFLKLSMIFIKVKLLHSKSRCISKPVIAGFDNMLNRDVMGNVQA